MHILTKISLPNIKKKVAGRLEKVNNALKALPELPANIELEIEGSLMQFSESCRKGIDEFVRESSSLPNSFRDCLLHIKPKFILKDRSDQPVVEISDDESDGASMTMTTTPTPTPKRRQYEGPQVTPSKRLRLDRVNGSSNSHAPFIKPDEAASPVSAMSATPRARRPKLPAPFAEYSSLGSGFRTLAQVKVEVQNKMKAGVPNVIPVDVYEDMALEAIRVWEQPMKKFLRETMMQLHQKLEVKLDQSLDRLRRRMIYRETAKHLKAFLHQQLQNAEEALDLMYKDETQQLLTFNFEAFNQYVKEESQQLRRFRHQMRYQAMFPDQSKTSLDWENMTPDQRLAEGKEREKENAKLGPDSFDRVIDVIAYVRGYYRLAALRFADTVAQLTLCRMIPTIRLRLDWELRNQLGIRGADAAIMYQRLMEEDAATATKREALKAEREKFVRALETIQTLENNPGMDESMYDTSSASFSYSFRERAGVVDDSQTTSDLASGEA